jgi:CheY-like chemotaxis protein
LDFSKLDSGRLSLEIKEFSVRALIDGISEMARNDAGEKYLSFDTSVDSNVPDLLLGDSVRLRQALFNVVMNAVKFTETGGVSIRVFPEEIHNKEEALLTFEVCDTGIGINDEQMADLFKPLHSGDSSYSRKHGGLGMGLSVSNSLAALMGGKITCESRPGEGSVFRITIPLALPGGKAEHTHADSVKSNLDVLHGLHVLVAEDNNINQIIIEELLSSAGITVTMANNGVEALAKLQKGNFDLVLMDVQMPEMDGLTATVQIRADHRYDGLPILAMTANAGKEHFDESIKAGMNDHLIKPIDVEHLYNALIKWSKRGL